MTRRLGFAPLPSDIAANYDPFFDFRSMGGSVYASYYSGETYAGGEQSPVGGLPAAPGGGVSVPAPGYTSTPGYTPFSPYSPVPQSKIPAVPEPKPVAPVTTAAPGSDQPAVSGWLIVGAVVLAFLIFSK